MEEPSKKRKGSSSWSQRYSETQETQIPSSISFSSLFSTEEQQIWYTNLFSSRSIIDPKFIDMDFFSNESFECIQAFENSNLIPFMFLKLSVYTKLVKGELHAERDVGLGLVVGFFFSSLFLQLFAFSTSIFYICNQDLTKHQFLIN